MKIYAFTGFNNDEYVFSFSAAAYNSHQAIEAACNNELIKDMKFNRLTMKEIEEWLH